jgi:hypothetical protein
VVICAASRIPSWLASNTSVLCVCIHSAMRCLSARLPYRPHMFTFVWLSRLSSFLPNVSAVLLQSVSFPQYSWCALPWL